MKRIVAAVALVAAGVYAVGFYLPGRGRAELDAAIREHRECSKVIIDYAPGHGGPGYSCFANFINRREEIVWRYFFLQTLVSHL